MYLGVIIGIFYNKGLILCPNNKLRYFDYIDGLKEEYKHKCMGKLDRYHNVFVINYIDKYSIASYKVDETDKNKAIIIKRYDLDKEKLEGLYSKELSYIIMQSDTISYDASKTINEITEYVQNLNIKEILSTYKIEEFKNVTPNYIKFGKRYTICTEDNYIKSHIPLRTKQETMYISGKEESAYTKRLFDEETQNIAVFMSTYSIVEHINYFVSKKINDEVKGLIESEVKKRNIQCIISKNFPIETIGYIINKKWPHMSPQMLCKKYNNEFDGTNYAIFGKEYNARKRYKEKQAMYNPQRKRSSYYYNSWDPESEIMRALYNGCGEYYGF